METQAVRFVELVNKIEKLALELHKIGMTTKSEFFILRFIKRCENFPDIPVITAISRHQKISKSAVSQMMNTLEEKKYIKRESNEGDKRLTKVVLTELGNQVLGKERDKMIFTICSALSQLGEKDSMTLVTLLSRYLDILEKEIEAI